MNERKLEVYDFRQKRVIFPVGNSLAVTLPPAWLRALKLRKGSKVVLVFNFNEKHVLKVIPIETRKDRPRIRYTPPISELVRPRRKQLQEEGSVSPAAKQRDTGRLTQRREDAGEQK